MTHVNFPSGAIPNREALAMDNLVPGAEMLGRVVNCPLCCGK
jgi:hypothetical protein